MSRITVALACWVLLSACQDGDANPTRVLVRDSAGVTIIENPGDLWSTPVRWHVSAEPVVRVGAVEGEEAYLFDGIRGVAVLTDGRLVVANGGDQSVRWYTPAGDFLFQRGGPGEGPGEFSRLGAITVLEGDTIVAVDWSGRRFTLFGPDGGVGRTTRIEGLTAPPGRVFRASSGYWILSTAGSSTAQLGSGPPQPGIYRFDSPVLRISPDGTSLDTIGQFPSSEVEVAEENGRFRFGPARVGRSLSYEFVRDQLLIATGDRMQFDLYSPSGNPVRSVRAPDVDVSLTPAVAAAYREFLRNRAANAPTEARAAAERSIDEMTLPETMPAYSTVIVSATGDIWIGEYRYDLQPAEQYLVFGAEGSFFGRVSVPPGVRIMAIAERRLWGRATDDLGVEYLVAHVFEEP